MFVVAAAAFALASAVAESVVVVVGFVAVRARISDTSNYK